jgi:hypothetical protein|tara:strand:+ start:133 stop:429 length:297 start_codon:yes stop_codon:yes gene_type:complete
MTNSELAQGNDLPEGAKEVLMRYAESGDAGRRGEFDKREMIPLLGILFTANNFVDGKSSMIDGDLFGASFYHTICTGLIGGAGYGIYLGGTKLIELLS